MFTSQLYFSKSGVRNKTRKYNNNDNFKTKEEGWRGGSVVEGTCNIGRRLMIGSHHVYEGPQPSATPVLRELTLSSDLCMHEALTWCTCIYVGKH